jgi:3',5'-cyclic AMP phosphodiesterase CpdA
MVQPVLARRRSLLVLALSLLALAGCGREIAYGDSRAVVPEPGLARQPPSAPREAELSDRRTREAEQPERAPPGVLREGEPIRVVVLSDLNGPYGSVTYSAPVQAAVRRVVALRPDLVISTGDMVAGQRGGLDYRAMWTAFHATVSDPLAAAGIPFAVTPGNHDASIYDDFARERAIFVEEWQARRPELPFQDDASYPLRYSFVAGPALFVSLDATRHGTLGAAQMRWLDRELRRGAHHPVKIVYGHVPLYPFAAGRERDFIGDPDLEALLLRHGVTLFISGHHHAYYPGRRGALRLLSMACLGDGPRTLIGAAERSARSIAVLEVTRAGITQLDAYTGRRFDTPILRETLPPFVGIPEARIDRDDLEVTLR